MLVELARGMWTTLRALFFEKKSRFNILKRRKRSKPAFADGMS